MGWKLFSFSTLKMFHCLLALVAFNEKREVIQGFLVAQMVKNVSAIWESGFHPWAVEDPLEKKCIVTPVFLPKSPMERSLNKLHSMELDAAERLTEMMTMKSFGSKNYDRHPYISYYFH